MSNECLQPFVTNYFKINCFTFFLAFLVPAISWPRWRQIFGLFYCFCHIKKEAMATEVHWEEWQWEPMKERKGKEKTWCGLKKSMKGTDIVGWDVKCLFIYLFIYKILLSVDHAGWQVQSVLHSKQSIEWRIQIYKTVIKQTWEKKRKEHKNKRTCLDRKKHGLAGWLIGLA